jgi:predicted RNase H-related nuclease YkuK (DUF458 family)
MEYFYSPQGKTYFYQELLREVLFYIKSDPEKHYKIIIGTDSANHNTTDFVSVLVVYKVGHGGRFFWRRIKSLKKISNLRNRIYEEVLISLNLAQKVLLTLSKENELKFDFEVHVDIGSKGETREMLQEIIFS